MYRRRAVVGPLSSPPPPFLCRARPVGPKIFLLVLVRKLLVSFSRHRTVLPLFSRAGGALGLVARASGEAYGAAITLSVLFPSMSSLSLTTLPCSRKRGDGRGVVWVWAHLAFVPTILCSGMALLCGCVLGGPVCLHPFPTPCVVSQGVGSAERVHPRRLMST